jgi:hypothetical protein
LGLLLASGFLDDIVGQGEERYVVWRKVEKIVTCFEEQKDGYFEERELESFMVYIKVIRQNGAIVHPDACSGHAELFKKTVLLEWAFESMPVANLTAARDGTGTFGTVWGQLFLMPR